jgi:hypothetical protein
MQALLDSLVVLALFPLCQGKEKRKGQRGGNSVREIYCCGLAGLQQNYELEVILALQQDQGAVDAGD